MSVNKSTTKPSDKSYWSYWFPEGHREDLSVEGESGRFPTKVAAINAAKEDTLEGGFTDCTLLVFQVHRMKIKTTVTVEE